MSSAFSTTSDMPCIKSSTWAPGRAAAYVPQACSMCSPTSLSRKAAQVQSRICSITGWGRIARRAIALGCLRSFPYTRPATSNQAMSAVEAKNLLKAPTIRPGAASKRSIRTAT
eukprot:15273367-Alexandrium_andersonii.AAC.2